MSPQEARTEEFQTVYRITLKQT